MDLIKVTSSDINEYRDYCGYLYVAVFTDGLVKVGISKHNPRVRLQCAISTAARWSKEDVYRTWVSDIHFNYKENEQILIRHIASVSVSGAKEWGRFDSVDKAISVIDYAKNMDFETGLSDEEKSEIDHSIYRLKEGLGMIVKHGVLEPDHVKPDAVELECQKTLLQNTCFQGGNHIAKGIADQLLSFYEAKGFHSEMDREIFTEVFSNINAVKHGSFSWIHQALSLYVYFTPLSQVFDEISYLLSKDSTYKDLFEYYRYIFNEVTHFTKEMLGESA
jgi:hypothetical protein